MIDKNLIILIIVMSISYVILNYLYLKLSEKKSFLKTSSEYNLHKNKVCNNGGIVFSSVFIIFLLYLSFTNGFMVNWEKEIPRPEIVYIVFILFLLSAIIDQFYGLHPVYRLIIQITLVFISLSTIHFPITEFLPLKLEYLLVLYFWVYIINTTNFIDGTDGMMTVTNLNLYFNILLFSFLTNKYSVAYEMSLLLIPISLIFLIFFNFPKAKMFIGDTGSIPIGFINGFLLFSLISDGELILAFAIFSYPIIDVTITLFIKTIIKRELPWSRLYDYFFLKPVIHNGKTHLYVLRFNIFNSLICLLSTYLVYSFDNKLFFLISIFSSIFLIFIFGKKK